MSTQIHEYLDKQNDLRPQVGVLTDTLGADWTYGDLNEASHILAAQLSAMGGQANDRVLIILENCAAAVAAIFAISRIGAAFIPFNARQTAGEIERIIEHAEPAAILFTSDVSKDAASHAQRLGATAVSAVSGVSGFEHD